MGVAYRARGQPSAALLPAPAARRVPAPPCGARLPTAPPVLTCSRGLPEGAWSLRLSAPTQTATSGAATPQPRSAAAGTRSRAALKRCVTSHTVSPADVGGMRRRWRHRAATGRARDAAVPAPLPTHVCDHSPSKVRQAGSPPSSPTHSIAGLYIYVPAPADHFSPRFEPLCGIHAGVKVRGPGCGCAPRLPQACGQ